MFAGVRAGWYALLRLCVAAALGALAGGLLGSAYWGLTLALAIYLAWQLVTLQRMEWWLRHRSIADPPRTGGTWGQIVTQVVRLHRRKRFHKQRFTRLLRQIETSTAALPDGVVMLNERREIIWFNRAAARLLGLRRPADVGLRIDHLVRDPRFLSYLGDARPGEAGQAETVVIRSGATRDALLQLQVLPYGEGQLLLVARDVSQQMRLDAVRRDFVANASHELRSPLTVISGYLETLSQDPAADPDLRSPLTAMRRQAVRMTTIVNDLLELSRLEATGEDVPGTPLDVGAMLAELRDGVLDRAVHPREIRVRVDSERSLIGTAAEIHSAFANLVDNAAKYTPADGSIEMCWSVDAAGGHFSIADTGIGIPPEHLPRLTERFYRVDPGRSRATGGSGLGLAIVKHVLQRHGATLDIHSTPGSGSVFTCHFPPTRIGEAPAGRGAVP